MNCVLVCVCVCGMCIIMYYWMTIKDLAKPQNADLMAHGKLANTIQAKNFWSARTDDYKWIQKIAKWKWSSRTSILLYGRLSRWGGSRSGIVPYGKHHRIESHGQWPQTPWIYEYMHAFMNIHNFSSSASDVCMHVRVYIMLVFYSNSIHFRTAMNEKKRGSAFHIASWRANHLLRHSIWMPIFAQIETFATAIERKYSQYTHDTN